MENEIESVWLGLERRATVRKLALWSVYLFAAICVWLIVGDLLFDLNIELRSALHPLSNMHVFACVITGFIALFTVSTYLSDFQGHIEPKADGFFDIFSLIWSRVAMISIVAVVCVMLFEVVSRYIFERPTLWANEAALWIAGFLFLFAGLYSMQQRSHIRIYIIYDMMPRWAQRLSDVITVLLIVLFAVALVWGGFNESLDKFSRMETFGTAWDPPLPGTIKPGILIIISLVAVQSVSNLFADWNKAPEHHAANDDIDETDIENIRRTLGDIDDA